MTGASNGAPGSGQDPAGTPPPAGQAPPAGTGQDPAAGNPDGDGDDVATLKSQLKAARDEAASYRTKARTLEQEKDAAATATLSDLEKAQKAAKDWEAKYVQLEATTKAQAVRFAAFEAANKLGYRSPELAHRLLNAADIEFSDDGEPKNVERLLRELAQKEGYLLKSGGQPDFGGGNRGQQPGSGPSMNDLIRAAAGKG